MIPTYGDEPVYDYNEDGMFIALDRWGAYHCRRIIDGEGNPANISKMQTPVRCNLCNGAVYDLGMVHVTARYLDCSMWKTPCCDRVADDRPRGWKSRCDITYLDHQGYPKERQ